MVYHRLEGDLIPRIEESELQSLVKGAGEPCLQVDLSFN